MLLDQLMYLEVLIAVFQKIYKALFKIFDQNSLIFNSF